MNISIASYAFYGLLKEGAIDLFGYLETCKYRYGMQTADIWNGMLPAPTMITWRRSKLDWTSAS